MAPSTPPQPFELTGDTITLNNSTSTNAAAYRLDPTRPNIVRAFHVYISGTTTTGGADITIIANTVAFGPGVVLDTSGKDAPKTYAPGAKPAPAASGKGGTAGAGGANATSAGNISIYAKSITGTVTVRARGGNGGRGQDGGDGGPGADGDQNPRQINMQSPNDPHNASGPSGGTGGIGGEAGPPGASGNGGNLDIWTAGAPPVVSFDGHGGAPPDVAQPARWRRAGWRGSGILLSRPRLH